jgi:tRNA modification GTPase
MGALQDTICALATAPGRAGIAVVRLSGSESFQLARNLFIPAHPLADFPERRAILGRIRDPISGVDLDEVLMTCFRAPHSYTGEDTAELSMHGSPVIISTVLERLCAGGARLAEPGEFTMRAFLLGRMDLAQAEAVRDVIEATTLFQAQVAARQRSGEISRRITPTKELLVDIIVNLESAVEFVEEALPVHSREKIATGLDGLLEEMGRWIEGAKQGRIIRDGFRMAIVGRPNVGKSSLFNALLGAERSIVTAIPGTTRDFVSEVASFEGIPVYLGDTAGIRNTGDAIEQLGVQRSFGALADSDLALLVVDAGRARSSEDDEVRGQLGSCLPVVVMNKSDLVPRWSKEEKEEFARTIPWVDVSCKTGAGLEDLRTMILNRLFRDSGALREGVLVTNLRHCRCLEGARTHLAEAANALRMGLSEEFVLHDLHAALRKLGEISGETKVEDLLKEIFSRFCVGK